MSMLEQSVGATSSSLSRRAYPEGSTTLIILERDGSLHHYPPDKIHTQKRAIVALDTDTVNVHDLSVIDKILDFTFDVLGISNLEMRVYEHQKR